MDNHSTTSSLGDDDHEVDYDIANRYGAADSDLTLCVAHTDESVMAAEDRAEAGGPTTGVDSTMRSNDANIRAPAHKRQLSQNL